MPQQKQSKKFQVEVYRPETPVAQPTPVWEQPYQLPNDPMDLVKERLGVKTFEENVKKDLNYTGARFASVLAPTLEFLSRPQYASARFFDSNVNESKGLLDSLADGWDEFISPKKKLSFADVITKTNPQRAKERPIETAVVGFLGDVFLDPTTYLGVGLFKTGLSIGGNTLRKGGVIALTEGLEEGSKLARFVPNVKGKVDLVRVLEFEQRTGQLVRNIANKDILSESGYFEYLAKKTDEISRYVSQNKIAAVSQDQIIDLAKKEILTDLKQQRKLGNNIDASFDNSTIRQTIEERIQTLATLDKDFRSKVFQEDGLHLTVGFPFSKSYEIPLSRKALQLTGLDYLADTIRTLGNKLGTTKVGETVGRTFVKEFDPKKQVPQEFWDELHSIENTFDSNAGYVIRNTKALSKLSADRQEFIGKLGADIRDATALKEKELLELGSELTKEEAAGIKASLIQNAKLTPEEFALMSQYYQGYSKMQELEMRAGLLNANVQNYWPRGYEILGDADEVADFVKGGRSLSTNLSSSKQTKYLTLAEAVADGYVPELNAAVLYATRLAKSREKLAAAQFNEATRRIFNIGKGNKQLTQQELRQLPKVALSSIRMLGDAVYPASLDDTFGSILKAVDVANGLFKKAAYALKPSAAPRQLISNTFQAAMLQGVKTFKAFDPRAFADAALLVFDRGKTTKNLPDAITSFFGKYAPSSSDAIFAERLALDKIVGAERLDDYASKFKLRTALGQTYDGEYLADWMQKNGVIKGFDATGESVKVQIERALKYNPDSIGQVAGELSKFWKWPTLSEDYSRAALFLNGLRMGYSEKQSLALVNKALFDYSRGLSYMEKNVMKRIIPFYTYQRFAIPYVLSQTAKNPGNVVTGQKFMQLLQKVYTGDTLSPAEQEIFGDNWIVEQPRLFKGFDKDGKASFNVFNNMTPLDALSILVYDKKGNLDYRRTVEKSVLAQMTPYLKVPLELVVDKNFFTEQVISKAGKLGDINKSTISMVIPDKFKELMGWENRINARTGKQAVYVNPYLAYTATSFVPAIKSWIVNPSQQDETPLEKAMDLFLGIKTEKIDFKEQQEYGIIRDKKEVKELKSKIRSARIKGSSSEYQKNLKDYETLIQAIKERNSIKGQVRGGGINPEEVPIPDAPETIPQI